MAGPQIGSFTANPNPVTAGSSVTLTDSNISDGDPHSTITQVAIYLDSNGDGKLEPDSDQLLGYASQTSPGMWTLTSTNAFGLTAGTYTLFAQAQDNYGLLGDADALSLTVATDPSFAVTGFPSPTTAGAAGTVTVTARNADGTVTTGYTGTVHFSSSDPRAVLPASYTFTDADKGVHTFTATLQTAGSQSLTATDTSNSSITGSATGITVTPSTAASLVLSSVPTSATAGSGFTMTVTALDAYGNIATGFSGAVHFSSSDPQAMLPADYSFTSIDQGVRNFSVTLQTAGSQSLTATDIVTSSLTSTASGIVVNPTFAESLVLSKVPTSTTAGSSFTLGVTAKDAYGNTATGYAGTVHFSSSDPQAVLPANYTFTSADQGRHTFAVTLETAGSQSLTAADTVQGWVWGRATGITVTASGIVVNPTPGGASSGGSGHGSNGGSATSGGPEGGSPGAVSSGGLSSPLPAPGQSAGFFGLALEMFELEIDDSLALVFSMMGQENQQNKDAIAGLLKAITDDLLYPTPLGWYACLLGYEAALSLI
jgi:hypothetical protein